MARARGARAQLAFAFESTYGTAPGSGFFKVPFASSALGQQQPLLDNELLGFGRDPVAPTRDAISADGDVSVPIDVENFGLWLKGAFGAPVTTEDTGVFTHVFESGAWTLPSMSIETGLPDVPSYAICTGCMVNTLRWTMQRSGRLTATVALMAQGENEPTAASGAGTPTSLDLRRFGHFNGAVTRDGSALANVVSAEIGYANNLDPVETIRADGKIDGIDPAMAALTGKVTVRFADRVLLDQAVAGDPCALSFSYTRSPSEKLTIDVPRVYLPRPKLQVDGPGGIEVTFDWQAAQQADGSPMCTATLINAVNGY